ncbi:MAG: T9SS type A sorting domain-containing protein [Thermaurantimonas sp.]|uniref:T9SS type A sorting domain-containing protein n=1 Tax=Thermaurantimonas sp. TaxID=2681568 RepID=UPI00391B495C
MKNLIRFSIQISLGLNSFFLYSQVAYTWNGSQNNQFINALNWTPTRNVPSNDDLLIFNSTATIALDGITSPYTVGQLILQTGADITFTSSSAVTINIIGSVGEDLAVCTTCKLTLSGSQAITIQILSGATAEINGEIVLTGSAHRLLPGVNNQDQIVFKNGGSLRATTGFTGNAFGNSGSTLNSVIFQNGSKYVFEAGGNPFGVSAPNSIVIFQSGSRFVQQTGSSPALADRIYADFEVNIPGSTTYSGSSTVTMNSFIITSGTVNFNINANSQIRGNIIVQTGASLNFNPSSNATLRLTGTSIQQISGDGSLSFGSNIQLRVENIAGVVINRNITINRIEALSGVPVTINSGNNLTINNAFDSQGNLIVDGTITLEATSATQYAMLKCTGIISGTGQVVQKQFLKEGWNMISQSLTASTAAFFGSIGTDAGHPNIKNFYSWNGQNWVNIPNNLATITPGTGYFGFVGQYGIYSSAGVRSFTGMPLTSVSLPTLTHQTADNAVNFTLSNNPADRTGWNLIGNPLTCALDFSTLTRTNVANAFYIYDHNGGNPVYRYYSGGGISDPYIAPMQAFWVKTTSLPASLHSGPIDMTNGIIPSTTPIRYKPQTSGIEDYFILRVFQISDTTKSDFVVLSIHPTATDGYDEEWDALKLKNGGVNPNIYCVSGTASLAVNTFSFSNNVSHKEFNIHFQSNLNQSQYFISHDDSKLTNSYNLYLIDKKTGNLHDLKTGPYYFFADTSYIDRFIFRISPNALSYNEESVFAKNVQVFIENRTLNILTKEYSDNVFVKIINVTGQIVLDKQIHLSKNEKTTIDLKPTIPAGVYTVILETTKGRILKKFLIF